MANDYDENPIILDTFTGNIDLGDLRGQDIFAVESIEWQQPATADDACVIKDDSSGRSIFDEVCVTAKQSLIKYYNGQKFPNLYIAASAVDSGKVVICLRENRQR